MKNSKIIKWFKLLINQIKYEDQDIKNSFRISSLSRSLDIISKLKFEITSVDQIKNIEYIGKGTIDRIDEILRTGKLKEVDLNFDKNVIFYLEDLEKVFGIGRKTSWELYKKYKIKTIDDLKVAVKNKKIVLPKSIITGLKYVDTIRREIPRKESDQVYLFLISQAINFDENLSITMCGSYRRMENYSNDFDIIVTHEDIRTLSQLENNSYLNLFIKKLKEENFIIAALTYKKINTKFMGLCKYKNNPVRRIDIRFVPIDSYYSAILYFTGPKEFNRKMRQIAIDSGLTLNEYGLFDRNNKRIKIKSEKDIFDKLQMEYLQPSQRK